jgi:HD-GYP domain-containing protein (c-di-GMP phosphodiesterase class II)
MHLEKNVSNSFIIVERGSASGSRFLLEKFPITIGRDLTNSVAIEDDEISRVHLRIKKRGRLFIIEDLDSKNGTFLNGDRIINSIIQNGDKILIGSTELQFVTSEGAVQLADEIMNFDMVIGPDLGIRGPITVGHFPKDAQVTPIRLTQFSIANYHEDDIKIIKEIFEHHSNVLVAENLTDASNVLLKSIGKIFSHSSRAAIFVWIPSRRMLYPIAIRHFKRKRQSFLISQHGLEDVLHRKQGALLIGDHRAESHELSRSRLILPITYNGDVNCLVHIEIDDPKFQIVNGEIEKIQALLSRCAPTIEALLLRREIDGLMFGMIETMIATIEAKDTYTHGHSERVSKYSMAIAEELKLNREVKRMLMISALCHDIGKIGIPDAILKKASILSAEEYEEMKLHPKIGSDIISNMPNARKFVSGIKYHHEKWDGTGYPEGLQGEEIPFFGRIVAIADVFDAMVSGRAYSGFMDQNDAIQRLLDERELFDPEILKACVRAHDSGSLTLKTNTAGNIPNRKKTSFKNDIDDKKSEISEENLSKNFKEKISGKKSS